MSRGNFLQLPFGDFVENLPRQGRNQRKNRGIKDWTAWSKTQGSAQDVRRDCTKCRNKKSCFQTANMAERRQDLEKKADFLKGNLILMRASSQDSGRLLTDWCRWQGKFPACFLVGGSNFCLYLCRKCAFQFYLGSGIMVTSYREDSENSVFSASCHFFAVKNG